jgi:hypothetical protein
MVVKPRTSLNRWSCRAARRRARACRAIWQAARPALATDTGAIVNKGLDELYARRARLESERDGLSEIKFPAELLARTNDPDLASILRGERRLFELRSSARSGQKAQFGQRIEQLAEEIRGLKSQRESKEKEIKLIVREKEGVYDLWKQKLVPLTKLTQIECDETRLEGEAGQLIAQTAQAGGKISETSCRSCRSTATSAARSPRRCARSKARSASSSNAR